MPARRGLLPQPWRYLRVYNQDRWPQGALWHNAPGAAYFSQAVAQAVVSGRAQRGIIVCGSGVGGSIAANKVPGARASICHDTYSAGQGVEHDDMNVLCLGARVVGEILARELVSAFLDAQFIDEEKYRRRLEKVIALERGTLSAGVTPTGGG